MKMSGYQWFKVNTFLWLKKYLKNFGVKGHNLVIFYIKKKVALAIKKKKKIKNWETSNILFSNVQQIKRISFKFCQKKKSRFAK